MTCKFQILENDWQIRECGSEIYGTGELCAKHELEFKRQWDSVHADPLDDIYHAALALSPRYEDKKHWGLKLSKHKRHKKEMER